MTVGTSKRPFDTIGILGAGAFGTALGISAHLAGRQVRLWCRSQTQAAGIGSTHRNAYLPGVDLPDTLTATHRLSDLKNCQALLLVTPAQSYQVMAQALYQQLSPRPLVICSKGIDQEQAKLLSDILLAELPNWPLAVLSGPAFAHDLAQGLPTAVSLACQDQALGMDLVTALGSRSLRPYYSPDVIGVQIGGAIKNVLAIACGIVDGLQLGESARAALMTRGLSELSRLTIALGGAQLTAMGLAGLGDLALSCNSPKSRNMRLGQLLGQGQTLDQAKTETGKLAEGVFTTKAISALVEREKIELPICQSVYSVLYENQSIGQVMTDLLSRPFRAEL